MPRRIPMSLERAISGDYRSGTASRRELAKRHHVARSTVARVVRIVNKTPVADLQKGRVRFRTVPPCWCEGCKRMVSLDPCPACLAREARKRNVKSATRSIRDPESEVRLAEMDRANTPILPPPAVMDWLEREISARIGRYGNRDEVDDAMDDVAAWMRSLCRQIGLRIGENRRLAQPA